MIFLDLDGVIVDFVKPAFARFCVPIQSEAEYPSGCEWDIVKAVNILIHKRTCGWGAPVEKNDFWNRFDFDFWRLLPKYPHANDFIRELEKIDDVIIATSYTLSPECSAGKVAWLTRWLPKYKRRNFITPCKSELGRIPGAILIDDRDKFCDDFASHGGRSILLPRPWNSGGLTERHPYDIVLEQLYEITNSK